MSVVVRERLIELGGQDMLMVEGFEGYGLASVTAADIRALSLGVVWDPLDGGIVGEAHAVVICKKTPSRKEALKRACVEVYRPPGQA